MDFVLPCTPTPQQRARHCATGLAYKSRTQKANELELELYLMPYRPKMPLQGPLELSFVAVFPVPQSWPAKRRKAALQAHMWHTGKPDLDNLCKQLKDAMTRLGFWEDDRQVARYGTMAKIYGERGEWQVCLKPLETCQG